MLSPHEIATLLLVKDAPGRIEANRAELDALLQLELIIVDYVTNANLNALRAMIQ